jgi:gamma-glutamylcyclotransferase
MHSKEICYFSYGSNLSKQQMLRRTGSVPPSKPAFLRDFKLAFRKVLEGEDVFATIVPTQGAIVHGVIYQCNSIAIEQLDRFEGVATGCYRRELIQVSCQDGTTFECFVYIGEAFSQTESAPSHHYLNFILSGAREHGLPSDYIRLVELRAIAPNIEKPI